jgi:hypothetical protein
VERELRQLNFLPLILLLAPLRRNKGSGSIAPPAPKRRTINGFACILDKAERWSGFRSGKLPRDKELVKLAYFRLRLHNPTGQAMPRYFFNTRIGDELISDPEGEVLRNADSAWNAARAMILELLSTEGAQASLLNAVIEVTDQEGNIVLEFPFAEAMLEVWDEPATKH